MYIGRYYIKYVNNKNSRFEYISQTCLFIDKINFERVIKTTVMENLFIRNINLSLKYQYRNNMFPQLRYINNTNWNKLELEIENLFIRTSRWYSDVVHYIYIARKSILCTNYTWLISIFINYKSTFLNLRWKIQFYIFVSKWFIYCIVLNCSIKAISRKIKKTIITFYAYIA